MDCDPAPPAWFKRCDPRLKGCTMCVPRAAGACPGLGALSRPCRVPTPAPRLIRRTTPSPPHSLAAGTQSVGLDGRSALCGDKGERPSGDALWPTLQSPGGAPNAPGQAQVRASCGTWDVLLACVHLRRSGGLRAPWDALFLACLGCPPFAAPGVPRGRTRAPRTLRWRTSTSKQ